MSETASSNKKTIHFYAPNEGGESYGKALEGSLQDDNDSSDDQGAAPVSENSKGKQSDERIENLVDLFREFLEAAANPATSKSTRARRNKKKKRVFGLTKSSQPETKSNNPYDYEQKYPQDRFGEEAAGNARVWLTYLDEAESFDRERVEGWKDTVDVLLVFAGLFSGVITTFVSQASQSLRQDDTQVSASLLFEITRLLRAQASGTPLNNITSSQLTPTSPFTPSTNSLLVNGLWFTSLAIALSTALFAVLAKQWLHYYLSSITGTAQEKARARQLRFKGFESWNVGAIVELLPILLYTAVGMFLTGIIILLFPLDTRVAWTLVVITGITYVLYFISVLLPIRYPGCPYTTSLTIYIGILVFALRKILRWISSRTLEKGFQAVWRRMKLKTRHTIQRLLRDTLRFINARLLYTLEFIRHRFRKLQSAIFTDGSPKFTNWREENIKTAVKDAGFLDFEALHWLYATSLNRSVHRIIARCAAVYPGTLLQFDRDILRNLDRTLEISETDLVDLRYGLCLDLLADINWRPHWRLLRSITNVEETDTEYRNYSHIAENVIDYNNDKIMRDVINNNIKLPLVMWSIFFERMPGNATTAARILTSELSGPFQWKCDPIRGSIPNVGFVFLDSKELGWWKLEYLYRYFPQVGSLRHESNYSLNNTFETRYLLLITIYRNLTSDEPFIADEEQRQKSLHHLFYHFWDWLRSKPPVPSEQYFAFFIDICCANAFWSESMTNRGRWAAGRCLDLIWKSMNTDVANHFPSTECNDISPIYQWCSRDLDPLLSQYTAPIFTLLFMPQNRHSLCIILSYDPDTVSHLKNCSRNLRNCFRFEREYILKNPIDLIKSVNPNVPSLFNILYDSSVLVQMWKFLLFQDLDVKKFLLVVKTKLDQEKLNNLHAAMTEEVRSSGGSNIHQGLKRSVHEFGQMIGVSHSQFESDTKQSAPEHTPDKDHDTEEHAHFVPDTNERGLRFIIANWTNQVFRSLRVKICSGNRDQDVDVELS